MLNPRPLRADVAGVCCQNLLCANCARPVADAGCSVCRTARADLHGPRMSVSAFALTVALLLLVAFLLALHA